MKKPAGKAAIALFAVLAWVSAGRSYADDAFPPCWRGSSGTTYQDWSFGGTNNPASPDAGTNVNGTAQVTLVVGDFGTGWNASVGGETGGWDLGRAGQATAVVPNFGGSPAWKYVQVQVTYFDAPGFYLPPVISIAGATLVSTQVVNTLPAPPGNWKTYQTAWLLQPSPASETIVFAGDSSKGLLIDEIIVDTRCATAGDGDVPAYRPCWRGQPATTFQQWLFGVSNNPAAIPPELVTNSFGVPNARIVAGPSSSGYTEENAALGCRQGIWDLGKLGTMTLTIPNTSFGSSSSFKYLRLQVTQYRDAVHNANASVAVSGGTLVGQQQQTIETNASGGQWVVAQSVWRLGPPCPSSESVVLTAGANGSLVDQVVVDTLCLDFPCPSDLATNADLGQCSRSNVTWVLPVVNGCTVTNVTSTPAYGSTLPVGTNHVTSVVSDGEGGTTTCTFNVVVADAEAPVARCKNIAVNLNASGSVTIAGADVDDGSTDNCGIATRSVTPNTFTCANEGANGVVLTVTDVHGNSSTCNATVTVQAGADLSIGGVNAANPATLGNHLTCVVTVSNGGPCTAVGVVLSNYLSAGQIALAVTNGLTGVGQGCPFPGPVAWWRAEGNGNDAASANNGAVSSGVTYVAGEVGQAFGFDGLTGTVAVPDAASLRPQSLTIEGWIKPRDVTGTRVLIGKRVGAGASDSYSLWIASGVLFAAVSDNTGFGPPMTCPAPLDQWVHVAYTFDAATQAQALYSNGVLVNAGLINQTIAYDAHPVLLGADDNNGSPGFFYQGEIDELTLYDRALTGTEIRAIYTAGAGGKCLTPGLVPLGTLASGASIQVSLVTVPTNCQPLSTSAGVTSATADPNLADNAMTLSVPVQGLPSGNLLLSIQRVGTDNNLLRISWPLTCDPSEFQAADALALPANWGPVAVPVLMLDSSNCSIVPASDDMKYFRVRIP